MEIGKAYIVRKKFCKLNVGEILHLKRYGYQAYYGEHNYVFKDKKDKSICMVLRDDDALDMDVYHHLDEYFEELDSI